MTVREAVALTRRSRRVPQPSCWRWRQACAKAAAVVQATDSRLYEALRLPSKGQRRLERRGWRCGMPFLTPLYTRGPSICARAGSSRGWWRRTRDGRWHRLIVVDQAIQTALRLCWLLLLYLARPILRGALHTQGGTGQWGGTIRRRKHSLRVCVFATTEACVWFTSGLSEEQVRRLGKAGEEGSKVLFEHATRFTHSTAQTRRMYSRVLRPSNRLQ